jgi:C4-dicarboxylate-specific signal transduction histidine kinase
MMHSEKMAALGTMAGGIAHEINTPLASINLTMDVIGEEARSGSLDPKYVEKMAREVNETVFKIAKIISSMRSFSQDASDPEFQPIRVRSIVEDTLVLCQSRLIGGGMGVNVNPIPANLYVSGNPSELSQMLMNLLNNAADATRGVPNANVKIEVRSQADSISIAVTDNGRGIPEEIRGKIMQPFFTTKEIGKGAGLGLSMALGIMEAHGGKLELDAKAKGTCFVATLPRIQARPVKSAS